MLLQCLVYPFFFYPLKKNCEKELAHNKLQQDKLHGTVIVYGRKVKVRFTSQESVSLQYLHVVIIRILRKPKK